ncbi:MAG: tetratricopeptide repeat protein [Nitrospinaceae bacterium]
MSLIADSLKRAHEERHAGSGDASFNLVPPASGDGRGQALWVKMLVLIVIPSVVLAYLIFVGVTREGRLFPLTPAVPPGVSNPSSQPGGLVEPKKPPAPVKPRRTVDAKSPAPSIKPKTLVTKKPGSPPGFPGSGFNESIQREARLLAPPVTPPALTGKDAARTPASASPPPSNRRQGSPGLPLAAGFPTTGAGDSAIPERTPLSPAAEEASRFQVRVLPQKPPDAPPTARETRPPIVKKAALKKNPAGAQAKGRQESGSVDVKTPVTSPRLLFEDPDFYFNMGVFYQQTGDFVEALDYYNKALRLDPANAEIYNNRSVIYKELGKYEKAVEGFMRAIHLNPRYVKAYNNVGLLYFLNDNLAGAAANFRKAIEIDAGNLESYNNLAIVYKKQKRSLAARKLYEKVLQLDPYQAEAHYNLALLHEEQGNLPAAIRHFRRFVTLGESSRPELAGEVRGHLPELEKRERAARPSDQSGE